MKIIFATWLALALVSACEPKGPTQKAGEHVDHALQDITGGTKNPFKEGPVEKAGKAVDHATDSKS